MLLSRQKPIARSADAWWPGGRRRHEGDVALSLRQGVHCGQPASGGK